MQAADGSLAAAASARVHQKTTCGCAQPEEDRVGWRRVETVNGGEKWRRRVEAASGGGEWRRQMEAANVYFFT